MLIYVVIKCYIELSKIHKIAPEGRFKDPFISIDRPLEGAKNLGLNITFHELSNGITYLKVKICRVHAWSVV